MLKIQATGFFGSWLYRLAYYGCGSDHWSVPRNLCPFLRRAVLGLILCLVVGVFAGSILAIVILDPVVSFALWAFGVGTGHFFTEVSLILGSAIWGLAALSACVFGVLYLHEEVGVPVPRIPKPKTYVERDGERVLTSWGVACEWWKGVHDKICPRIEFKD